MGCIGGSVEGQETPREALQREALEEIGCRIELVEPGQRVGVDLDGNVSRLAKTDMPEGAWLCWEGSKEGFVGSKVMVLLGRPAGEPTAVELPAILTPDLDTTFALGGGALTVQDALNRGATLVERQKIPRRGRLVPVGTVQVLTDLGSSGSKLLRRNFERLL